MERAASDVRPPVVGWCGLVRGALALEAVAAVHGLVAARLERHFGRSAAAAARRPEHLALAAAVVARAAAAAAFGRFTGGPAIGATARLVLEAFLSVEFLLAGSERKLLTAVHACDQLIGIHLVQTPTA